MIERQKRVQRKDQKLELIDRWEKRNNASKENDGPESPVVLCHYKKDQADFQGSELCSQGADAESRVLYSQNRLILSRSP